jgi:hypothetical protein
MWPVVDVDGDGGAAVAVVGVLRSVVVPVVGGAVRLREQLDQGHTLAAAARIIGLQDQLTDAENKIADLRQQLGDTTP